MSFARTEGDERPSAADLISIGPTETMHFQTWSDKAGAAVSTPLAPLTDLTNGLTFPDLNSPPFRGDSFTTNLIVPEPCQQFFDLLHQLTSEADAAKRNGN